MKYTKTTILLLSLLFILYSIFYIQYSTPIAHAFESSSLNFEIHAGDLESTVASSSSATFQLRNAGGQIATASSSVNTTSISSGILYWLFGWFTARYDQIHYRWREDDSGCIETSTTPACWLVAQDTQYNPIPKNVLKRLRIEVSNEGWTRPAQVPSFTLEVAPLVTTCTAATYAPVPTTYGSAWVIATTSPNLTNNTATTNVTSGLTDEGVSFLAGFVKTSDNTATTLVSPPTSAQFTELEYALLATDNAVNGSTYCFRLNDNQAPSRMGYSETKYAKAQLQSGLPATGTLDSAVFDTYNGGGVGLNAGYNSIMWNGSQNGSFGKVQFQFATSDNSGGSWTFIGGATCDVNGYYDTTGPGMPTELSCSSLNHNNQRYFRYRVRLCSAANCADNGLLSPIVTGVVVNWAP